MAAREGFIGGSLARYFKNQGFKRIRGIDKKPLYEWYQVVPGVESLCMDLSKESNCKRACEGTKDVYNLAADMGGMGFIERFRVECLRSVLINTHMIEAAYNAGAERGMKTAIARFHNVYGPNGTWDGGREKAPAALCRKVIEDGDVPEKREFCRVHGIDYLVLKREPAPGLTRRSSTDLRGF